MEKYLFITDYQFGTISKIEVVEAECEQDAVEKWIKAIDFPYIGPKSIRKMLLQIRQGEEYPVKIRGFSEIKNLIFFLNGKSLLTNYLKIRNTPDVRESDSSFVFFVLFQRGNFIYKSPVKCLEKVMPHWSRYLSWRYYSKEERAAIRKAVSEMPSLNMVIEGLVWKFESSILGNRLEVYIVELEEAS